MFCDPYSEMAEPGDAPDAILDLATKAIVTVGLCGDEHPRQLVTAVIGWREQIIQQLSATESGRRLAPVIWAIAYDLAVEHLCSQVPEEHRDGALARSGDFFALMDAQIHRLLGRTG